MNQTAKIVEEGASVDLMRAGEAVATYLDAFGASVRETRLTAALAFLVARRPEPFMKLFGFRGEARSVVVEHRHEDGRSDILVETTAGIGVIEAKVDATDARGQAEKYRGRWTIVLSRYVPVRRHGRRVRYVTWDDVADVLWSVRRNRDPAVRFVSRDLLEYLETHAMTQNRESAEIYARELNEMDSVAVFLQAHLYGCWYKRGSRLPEARYFAPHFGHRIATLQPGVKQGISYIARIDRVEKVKTWDDLVHAFVAVRGRHAWNRHAPVIERLHTRWNWNDADERNILFLAPPRLVFNPPVAKDALQGGTGFLSKQFLSFDELFAAWGC